MSTKILNNEEMAFFCDQMSMIIEAGITPMEGISIMLEDTENKEGREVLEAINEKCEAGESFTMLLVPAMHFQNTHSI